MPVCYQPKGATILIVIYLISKENNITEGGSAANGSLLCLRISQFQSGIVSTIFKKHVAYKETVADHAVGTGCLHLQPTIARR